MCQNKEEVKSKIDRLVHALERHTDAIERWLVANPVQDGLKGHPGSLSSGAGTICASS